MNGGEMIIYGFTKEIDKSFDETIDLVSNELKKEGFGILTKIDVKDKLKEKLGIDFKKYVILGACSPSNAYKAICAEENIGLLLPCNVIIYEKDDKIVVSIIKPTVSMQMIKNSKLKEEAEDVELKLKKVFNAISR
jgi:uncharacterized protein (DUF302 family)